MGTQGKRDPGESGKVHRDQNMQDLKATPGFIGSFQVQLQGFKQGRDVTTFVFQKDHSAVPS